MLAIRFPLARSHLTAQNAGMGQEHDDYADHELPPTWRTGYAVLGLVVGGPLLLCVFLFTLGFYLWYTDAGR
jgi:hypothetical protein